MAGRLGFGFARSSFSELCERDKQVLLADWMFVCFGLVCFLAWRFVESFPTQNSPVESCPIDRRFSR
jgi:hypothetical protein